jgi:hypothetical protein
MMHQFYRECVERFKDPGRHTFDTSDIATNRCLTPRLLTDGASAPYGESPVKTRKRLLLHANAKRVMISDVSGLYRSFVQNNRRINMSSVAKITEISASSEKSFADAMDVGISRASKTLNNITGAWVNEMKVDVKDGKITDYRVNMKVTFIIED